MMWKTHLAFGFLVGLFAIQAFKPANQILFLTLFCLASVLPDIDHPNSKIGSKFKIIGKLFEHRGFFHGVFAVLLFSFLSFLIFRQFIYIEAVFYGYISHLLADAFTHQGIMPLHPFFRTKIKGVFKTGEVVEHVIFFVLVILAGWKMVHL